MGENRDLFRFEIIKQILLSVSDQLMFSRLPTGDLDSNYSVIGQNMHTDPGADQMFHSTIMQVVLGHVGDYGELVKCLHV